MSRSLQSPRFRRRVRRPATPGDPELARDAILTAVQPMRCRFGDMTSCARDERGGSLKAEAAPLPRSTRSGPLLQMSEQRCSDARPFPAAWDRSKNIDAPLTRTTRKTTARSRKEKSGAPLPRNVSNRTDAMRPAVLATVIALKRQFADCMGDVKGVLRAAIICPFRQPGEISAGPPDRKPGRQKTVTCQCHIAVRGPDSKRPARLPSTWKCPRSGSP